MFMKCLRLRRSCSLRAIGAPDWLRQPGLGTRGNSKASRRSVYCGSREVHSRELDGVWEQRLLEDSWILWATASTTYQDIFNWCHSLVNEAAGSHSSKNALAPAAPFLEAQAVSLGKCMNFARSYVKSSHRHVLDFSSSKFHPTMLPLMQGMSPLLHLGRIDRSFLAWLELKPVVLLTEPGLPACFAVHFFDKKVVDSLHLRTDKTLKNGKDQLENANRLRVHQFTIINNHYKSGIEKTLFPKQDWENFIPQTGLPARVSYSLLKRKAWWLC